MRKRTPGAATSGRLIRSAAILCSVAVSPSCGTGASDPCFSVLPGGSSCPISRPALPGCAELSSSQFHWTLTGFSSSDVLQPDDPDQVTALIRVGESREPRVLAEAPYLTGEDCSGKALDVDWLQSNPSVAALAVAGDPREARLTGLHPGDTVITAILRFDDAPPLTVFPRSSVDVGSRPVTRVRIVAR